MAIALYITLQATSRRCAMPAANGIDTRSRTKNGATTRCVPAMMSVLRIPVIYCLTTNQIIPSYPHADLCSSHTILSGDEHYFHLRPHSRVDHFLLLQVSTQPPRPPQLPTYFIHVSNIFSECVFKAIKQIVVKKS